MPVSFPWGEVNPEGKSEWKCPHCNVTFCTSRGHYYMRHYNGQCLVSTPAEQPAGVQQESADGYVDDSGEQHTGTAAVYARQHDAAVAEFQQLCLDAGLSNEQLLALQPGFHLLRNPFRQLLEQLPADDDDTPEAEAEEDIQDQSEALHQRLQGQLCAGESQAGALEAWVRIFDWRCRHHIKDRAIDDLLPLLAALLPTDAVLPSSLRQLRRVLGVKRPSEYTYYACRSGKCFLEPLKDGQDPLKLPKCDCAGKHVWFEKVRLPNGRTANQATGQAFYLLDPAAAIRQLFLMPEFAAARTTARTYNIPGTWYASPHYKRLNDATGGLLDALLNSGWELGADGVNLTLSRKNSTSVFIIRCRDLPEHMVAQARFNRIVMVVPGGSDTIQCWEACLSALGQALGKLSEGIRVIPAVVDPVTGKVKAGEPFVHKAFISTIYADAPFRAKLLFLVGGFTALLVCAFCRLTGCRKGPGKGTMRYLGYACASTATAGPGVNQQFQLGVADSQRLYSSADTQHLVETAEQLRQIGREKEAQQNTGYHGMSPLLRCLPYQDVRTVSVVPFMHAYLQGVLKDWLKGFFVSPNKPQPQRTTGMAGSSLPKRRGAKRQRGNSSRQQPPADDEADQQQQQEAGQDDADEGQQGQEQQRAGQAAQYVSPAMLLAPEQRCSHPMRHVVSARCQGFKGGLHPQQNRPVSDIVKLHAGLTFEELANGVRGFFAHLLWPVRVGNMVAEVLTDPLVAEAYGCLRAFGHFHLTQGSWGSWQEFEAAVDAAQARILRYGAIAEQDFTADKQPAMCNAAACTSNLHSLSCQLAVQAKDRGHTVHWLEDWVERALGRLSARTRGRVVRDPAHVAASIELDLRAIQTAAVLAGVQLGDDGTLLGLAVMQADIDAAIAAPSVAASCMALGKPKSFPYAVVEGEAAVRWQDVEAEVRRSLTQHGLLEQWEAAWQQGAELAQVYVQAQLQGGTWITSRSYTRHQTRNASRVLVDVGSGSSSSSSGVRPRVGEVEYYLKLRQPDDDGADSSSSSSSLLIAMLRVLKTKVQVQHHVADLLLEAYDGVYEQRSGVDRLWAVPVQHIRAALDVCRQNVDGTVMLTATPVTGRSKRVAFGTS